MKRTQAAQRYIHFVSRYFPMLLDTLIIEAQTVAVERGAPMLGKIHLDEALERLCPELDGEFGYIKEAA